MAEFILPTSCLGSDPNYRSRSSQSLRVALGTILSQASWDLINFIIDPSSIKPPVQTRGLRSGPRMKLCETVQTVVVPALPQSVCLLPSQYTAALSVSRGWCKQVCRPSLERSAVRPAATVQRGPSCVSARNLTAQREKWTPESSGHLVWMSEELSSQMVSAFSSLLIPKLVSKNSKIVQSNSPSKLAPLPRFAVFPTSSFQPEMHFPASLPSFRFSLSLQRPVSLSTAP